MASFSDVISRWRVFGSTIDSQTLTSMRGSILSLGGETHFPTSLGLEVKNVRRDSAQRRKHKVFKQMVGIDQDTRTDRSHQGMIDTIDFFSIFLFRIKREICFQNNTQPLVLQAVEAIIASGFSETEHVKQTHDLGTSDYLKKPYTMEKIGLAVRTAPHAGRQ